jgi:hypothetical protein
MNGRVDGETKRRGVDFPSPSMMQPGDRKCIGTSMRSQMSLQREFTTSPSVALPTKLATTTTFAIAEKDIVLTGDSNSHLRRKANFNRSKCPRREDETKPGKIRNLSIASEQTTVGHRFLDVLPVDPKCVCRIGIAFNMAFALRRANPPTKACASRQETHKDELQGLPGRIPSKSLLPVIVVPMDGRPRQPPLDHVSDFVVVRLCVPHLVMLMGWV